MTASGFSRFERRLPLFFLLLAIPMAWTLVGLTPPFQVADEISHFVRAYDISMGRIRPHHHPERGTGNMLPVSLAQMYFDIVGEEPIEEYRSADPSAWRPWIRERGIHPEHDFFQPMPAAGIYPPWLYGPQAAGIALARAMGFGPLGVFYAGRLANALMFALLIAAAIHLAPFQRGVLAGLSLMPMSLYQAASLSADAMTLAWIPLYIAVVWRCAAECERHGAAPSRRWTGAVALAAVGAGLTKGYFPLLLVLLAVPRHVFAGRAAQLRWLAAMVAAFVIPLGLWSYWVSDLTLQAKPGIDPRAQAALLIREPTLFLSALSGTLGDPFMFLVRSFVGVLGHLQVFLPDGLIWTWCGGLAAAALYGARPAFPEPGLRLRAWSAAAALAAFALTTVWIYLTWNEVGSRSPILGLQGRYFIPFAPLLLVAFQRRCAAPRTQMMVHGALLALALVSFGVAVTALWDYYYA